MSAEFIKSCQTLDLASRWMTPFFRISSDIPKMRRIQEFLDPFLQSGLPVSGQIMGTDAQKLARTAELMLQYGCSDIDLNCGCPSRRVTSGNAGGGMLRCRENLREVCSGLREVIPTGKFSVKTRIGWQCDEMEEILALLVSCKADRIFVHIRTVAEQYQDISSLRQSRFDRLYDFARNHPRITWIFNGDIEFGSPVIPQLESATFPAGVMICRNWMKDPFLLKRLSACDKTEIPDIRSGCRIFYREFLKHCHRRGPQLEVAKMLWGANSEEFSRCKSEVADH